MINGIFKRFNITGLCIPAEHYMVDINTKIETIINKYIEPGAYFVINRARQYGKTTTLALLEERLSKRYTVIRLSFEGSEDLFTSQRVLTRGICLMIMDALYDMDAVYLSEPVDPELPLRDLSNRITKLCKDADRPIILMIDEVDRASNYEVFVSFLGTLRKKYLDRGKYGMDSTFHSVILAGVHDIKNLKAKIRPESEHTYNSPWNIAAPFEVDMSFAPDEIATMLTEYEADYHTGMDIGAVSERLYYYTSGYPFLVSALCMMIHEKSFGWNKTGADTAADLLVLKTNTLFDDVIKNIENNPSFAGMVEAILIQGKDISYVISDRDVSLGVMYGIFRREGTRVAISNRIFEKYIYEHMLIRVSKLNLLSPLDSEKSIS